MSFLGDAFAIPAAKTAPAPNTTNNPVAAPAEAAQPVLNPEDSAARTTDPNVHAATAKVNIAPPIPGQAAAPIELTEAANIGADSVVVVTDKAAKEVHRIVEEQQLPGDTGLRLGVQGGGCSGFSYKLAFETVKAPLDWEGNSNGIRIYIDPKSFLYLAGIELDFQDSLMGRGFVFNNPNAKKTCGCGESFTV